MNGTAILRRMEQAMNAHDLDAFVDCFTEDFVSELPLHPEGNFAGPENVRKNWAGLFAHVPDLVGDSPSVRRGRGQDLERVGDSREYAGR
ncbi:nuclear transport factor 2 family protein [Streptomyces violascens]|uniref:nuclear transport factor 2 family protein n=1 Tax=Streptomyces violascens TaxID=67381 RepID=UPI0037A406C6